MTLLVLVILAVMWVVVLVPPLLRSRQEGRPSDSVVSFRRQLSTLQRTGPQLRSAGRPGTAVRAVYGPAARPPRTTPAARVSYGYEAMPAPSYAPRNGRAAARRRRQNILFGLASLVGATLLLAVASGSRTFWYANAVADVFLLGYVYLLVQMRKLAQQRGYTVRPAWSSAA